MRTCIPVLLAALFVAPGPAPAPRHIEVAPGIHLFMTPPYGDVGLDGNSVAIVGDDGLVVVSDSARRPRPRRC